MVPAEQDSEHTTAQQVEDGEWSCEEVAALYRHMDNLVHIRINALLVTEAIFFSVSSALITTSRLLVIIGFLGLAVTVVWWITINLIHVKLRWLGQQYEECSKLFKRFRSVGRPDSPPPLLRDRTGILLCHILPALFFFCWIALLVLQSSAL
jgi:hypothetical protein